MMRIATIFLMVMLIWTFPVYAQHRPLHGNYKEYDVAGHLKAILKYQHGRLIRKRIYDRRGQLVIDTVYRDGVPILMKTYYANGQLKSYWSKKKGESQYYYPTGTRKAAVSN